MSRGGSDRDFPDVRNMFNASRSEPKSSRSKNRRSVQNIIDDSYDKLNENDLRNSKNSKESHRKGSVQENERNKGTKTLTERDLRHLERRLSMKKTIRKQISRNLAQAFIDDPNITHHDDDDDDANDLENVKVNQKCDINKNVRCLTINQSKVSKCEPTVLDMLKGCNETGRVTADQYGDENVGDANDLENGRSNSRHVDEGKKSFWKFLSIWGRK